MTGTAPEDQLSRELDRVARELSLLKSVTGAMLGTLDLDQILYVILSGITSAEGLGFNRAFRVVMALEPASEREARKIWEEMHQEGLTLDQLLPRYEEYRQDKRAHRLARWLGSALLPLDRIHELAAPARWLESGENVKLLPVMAHCLASSTAFTSNSLTLHHRPPHLGAQGMDFRKLAIVPLKVGGAAAGDDLGR